MNGDRDNVTATMNVGTRPGESLHVVAAPSGRLQSLDVLRAIAVLLVLGRHMPQLSDSGTQVGSIILLLWKNGGWIGVDLFFVLSGFLVSGLLFSEYCKYGTITIRRFLIRRGLKLYPAFYIMLICMCGVIYYRSGQVPAPQLLSEALFLQSYLPCLAEHTWSLGVEEHFYLVLPLVLAILIKVGNQSRPFRSIPVLFVLCAATLLGLRVFKAINVPYSHSTHIYPTHIRFDSLLFGVLLSYYHQFHSESFSTLCQRHRIKLAFCGVAGFIPFFLFRLETSPPIYSVGLSILYLSSGALVMFAMTCELSKKTQLSIASCLSWIGYHSYSIYLWHMLVLSVALPWTVSAIGSEPGPEIQFTIYVVEAIAFGIIAAKVIEVPVLRLRDRLWPSLSGGGVAQSSIRVEPQALPGGSQSLLSSVDSSRLPSAGS